jgi:Cys-tRNA(Pro) deacylase
MANLTTRITALLDEQGVAYRVLPHTEPVFTVEAAAQQRGVRQEEMVKSILLRDRQRRYVIACVTGDAQLDPKAVRDCLPDDWKRLSFASREEIFEVTGYVQGAVAPLGLPVDVAVVFDEAIGRCEWVNISSGDPMAGLELRPQDLIRLAKAVLAPIAVSVAGSQ